MAKQKIIIVEFGVPETIYDVLVRTASIKGISMDQLCTVMMGAGYAALQNARYFRNGTD